MAGKAYDFSSISDFIRNDKLPCSSGSLDPDWIPNSSPVFHGAKSIVNFENVSSKAEQAGEEDYDLSFNQPEKKRRLTVNQVQFLEKTFEFENKLEPERKIQLANELGLQPRQVAIWFQNRRARFKTKQLEKDYDHLEADYNKLKADYEILLIENEKLKDEMNSLKEKHNNIDVGKEELEQLNAIELYTAEPDKRRVVSEAKLVCKQENESSSRSDVLDSDSPYYSDHGKHHPITLEPVDYYSELSQDEDDNKYHLPSPCLLKVEERCYNDLHPSSSSCHFGFGIEDQPFCFWPY